MRPTEKKIENLIHNLNDTTRPELDEKILEDCNQVLNTQASSATNQGPKIWSIIMHSKLSKPLAAACILIAAVLSLTVFNQTVSKVYALDDTIQAYHSIRSIHVKEINAKEVQGAIWSSDIWIECDDNGNFLKFRYQTPYAGSIGALTVVHDGTGTYAWLPQYNLCYQTSSQPYYDSIIFLNWDITEVDPMYIFEDLLSKRELGEVVLDIETPTEKTRPIVVTVTYPETSLSYNHKKILYIDQATKLLKKSELYFRTADQPDELVKTTEFSDHNQAFESSIFTLEDELPEHILRIDQSDKEAGLPQDDMTPEEIANEITRQFFEALIAKDYNKAGLLYSGAPGLIVKQQLMGAHVKEILSVGPARSSTSPGSQAMISSCKALIESFGQTYELDMHEMVVHQVSDYPRRWAITGNSGTVGPVKGKVTISEEPADLEAATYHNPKPGKFMKKWLVLGPLPYYVPDGSDGLSKEGQQKAFDADAIDPGIFSEEVDITNVYYQSPVHWRLLETNIDTIYLNQLDDNKNDFQIAYLCARIEMDQDQTVYLGIGSDDGVKVWLNGDLVHEKWLYRDIIPDNDRVQINLTAGTNYLVLKVQNALTHWGFCCRILEK